MSSDVDTGELPVIGDANQTAAPGEPVGRVNLPDEPEADVESMVMLSDPPNEGMREKVLFGVLAVLMMVGALVVILQGVFEQKLPV